jgi:hypothetical protein
MQKEVKRKSRTSRMSFLLPAKGSNGENVEHAHGLDLSEALIEKKKPKSVF